MNAYCTCDTSTPCQFASLGTVEATDLDGGSFGSASAELAPLRGEKTDMLDAYNSATRTTVPNSKAPVPRREIVATVSPRYRPLVLTCVLTVLKACDGTPSRQHVTAIPTGPQCKSGLQWLLESSFSLPS